MASRLFMLEMMSIATGATQLIHNATLRLVTTDQFQTLWDTANRRAHDAEHAAQYEPGAAAVAFHQQ